MKPTGIALLVLAGLLCVFAGTAHLILDVKPNEQAGAVNGQAEHSSGMYWLALIPAAAAAAAGLYMVLTRSKGYQTNYDVRNQQAPRHA